MAGLCDLAMTQAGWRLLSAQSDLTTELLADGRSQFLLEALLRAKSWKTMMMVAVLRRAGDAFSSLRNATIRRGRLQA